MMRSNAEPVYEADHGTGPSAHDDEAAFDDVGGAQSAPQVLRHVKEREQVGQIPFEFKCVGFQTANARESSHGSRNRVERY
jgi:hypothetical protein